jgi:histidyl-tRNA synthetase
LEEHQIVDLGVAGSNPAPGTGKSMTVSPRVSRGLRDLFPEQMIPRARMIETIRRVYELYGFVPCSTPAIEYLDVLTGAAGQESQQTIFHVTNPEHEALGLRFDLTVPLARVVAQYRDLPKPFRRYQLASVWRADKPDKGRYREFTQLDVDCVGVKSPLADTEIIAAVADSMSALGITRSVIRFSSRGILELLLADLAVPSDRGADVFRVLDKLDKVGPAKVRLELMGGYQDESGDPIPGVGLASEQVDKIEAFLAITGTRREIVRQIRARFDGPAVATVEEISERLYLLGYDDDRVALDPSLARGLAYYTGPVFEAHLLDAPQFGSVVGGGRYDNLISRFSGEAIPAVGASIGIDRLLAALAHLGAVKAAKSTARVLVIDLDPALADEYLQMTWELRRAGIPTELYLGSARGLGKQMKYCDQCEIPIAVLYGSSERQQGIVTIKDMVVGREKAKAVGDRKEWLEARAGQFTAPRAELVTTIRNLIAAIEASER